MSEEKKPHHHIEINPLDEKKKKSMGNRIIVAAILIAIALPCIILGSWYWFAFVAVFLGIAAYEVLKAPQKKYKWYIWVFWNSSLIPIPLSSTIYVIYALLSLTSFSSTESFT